VSPRGGRAGVAEQPLYRCPDRGGVLMPPRGPSWHRNGHIGHRTATISGIVRRPPSGRPGDQATGTRADPGKIRG